MAGVNFNSNIALSKNLSKTIDLFKTVDIAQIVNLTGVVADAEAVADVVGFQVGGPSTPGGRFVIDDFNGDFFPENVVEDTTTGDGPESSETSIDKDGPDTPPCLPQNGNDLDGPNWVMNVRGGRDGWTRTIEADLISFDAVSAEICDSCDAGHHVAGAGGSLGNTAFIYQAGTSGAPVDLSGANAIRFLYAADLDGAIVRFSFDDDTDPNTAPDLVVESGPLDNTSNSSSVTNLTPQTIPLTPAQSALLDDVQEVRIDITGVTDLDLTIDCVELLFPPTGGGVNVETFAEVQIEIDPSGFNSAESFSQALAAYSPGDVDMFV